jgi:UDP-N-acetylglucosamine diphosphorylase/glucosamine-1-phosphate N-acetyltransferase
MIDYPWDLVTHNAAMLRQDYLLRSGAEDPSYRPASLVINGPSELLRADPSAQIEPYVVADTTHGPVLIDRGAVIHAFSRLEGPCYIGPETHVFGAKVGGSSIGPHCRIGGEVEASIIHGHSNKYHDGFLGHSYVGEWVNLAAGTQVSDLRHDYQAIHITVQGRQVDTELNKLGAIIGDHAKLGLNVLLNTGSLVGAFCNLLPANGYLPRSIPSFCSVWNGRLREQTDMQHLLATADIVMRRRGHELTIPHQALYCRLFDQTAAERRQAIREREARALRRSA